MLQERLTELRNGNGSVQSRDQADQVHAHELKRLRQDVETLHNQKEQLRLHLADQDREREELQSNFLYVKGQLDKVQMKQANAAGNHTSDCANEIKKHRQTLDKVDEEKKRLVMRLDSALKDAEKEKAYHEQSLERVVTANARLMEEKDRVAREVQRLSKLYTESMNNMQNDSGGMGSGIGFGSEVSEVDGGDQVDHDEIRRIQDQIKKADEALAKKEQENLSLKNRIRKLAVA